MSDGTTDYLTGCTDKDLAERLKVLVESVNSVIHELDRRRFDVNISVGAVDEALKPKIYVISQVAGMTLRSVTRSEVISLL